MLNKSVDWDEIHWQQIFLFSLRKDTSYIFIENLLEKKKILDMLEYQFKLETVISSY